MNGKIFLSSLVSALVSAGELSKSDIDALVPKLFNADDPEQNELIKFAKGAITPTELAVSGTLSSTRANLFIDLIQDESAFLQKTTVVPMASLESDYDVWSMASGVLVRVAEGIDPTDAQKKVIQNVGRTLNAKSVQLFADVLRSTIINNQNNPNLMAMLDRSFAKKFGDEIVLLGFTGTADDYAGGLFTELNKGWVHLAANEADSKKTTYASDATMVERLDALIANSDDTMPDDAKILIHRKDFVKYASEVGAATNNAQLIMQAAATGHGGYGFEITSKMPRGTHILTPLKNLVTGVCSTISRDRAWNSRKRAIEYTFDFATDYDLAVPKHASYITEVV